MASTRLQGYLAISVHPLRVFARNFKMLLFRVSEGQLCPQLGYIDRLVAILTASGDFDA